MSIAIEIAALNLSVAIFCGAVIGLERQVRQRMAGLRTNALVALGAAGFVVFAALFPNEVSPTRVAAQVVSGIGFLGAGIIFRHGFTIHGVNTAATLWCSAAVGMMAGAGALLFALLLTAQVVFINVGLRPVVRWLKKKTNAGVPLTLDYRVTVSTSSKHEAKVRALLLRCFSIPGFKVTEVERTEGADAEQVQLVASISGDEAQEESVEQAVAALMVDPKVIKVGWESSAEI